MKLDSYTVRHYKSLSDVTVHLHPKITLIVGPNSVGKSNFVDAMRFLRDAAKDDLDHALVSRGGITRIRQQTTGGGRPFNLTFEVAATQTFQELEPRIATYMLELTNVRGGEFKVEREEAECFEENEGHDQDRDEYFFYSLSEGFVRSRDGNVTLKDGRPSRQFQFNETEKLFLGASIPDDFFYTAAARSCEQFFSGWKFTTLYPTVLRELKTPDSETGLREDGSNWASVVRAFKKTAKGRQNLDRINEMMQQVLPDFQDVSVTTAGSFLVPKFRFGDPEKGSVKREFDPVQLSDGTLRIYGILLSLYQTPPPQLLVIEEPEQTVHPGVLAMLAEAFKEVSGQTQIVVTTHSPQLVEHFEPENIRVATMTDGATHISGIKKTQQQAVISGLISLGEFMAAEGLQPESSE